VVEHAHGLAHGRRRRVGGAQAPLELRAERGQRLAGVARIAEAVVEPPAAVREAVRMLDHGTATVAETAARTFVSERALQRRFAQDVGYGPKVLQRVLRFQRFMRELATPRVELARAGLLAGYADQSHLTRETRRLAGLSPRQLTRWQH
jgi:AraC-like DNA-binding protein